MYCTLQYTSKPAEPALPAKQHRPGGDRGAAASDISPRQPLQWSLTWIGIGANNDAPVK